MVKRTITHSLNVFVHGMSDPIEVTDATNALEVLEQFKQQAVLKIKVSGKSDAECTMYVPYHAVMAVTDCPTTTSTTVEDNMCVKYTDPCGPSDKEEEPGNP